MEYGGYVDAVLTCEQEENFVWRCHCPTKRHTSLALGWWLSRQFIGVVTSSPTSIAFFLVFDDGTTALMATMMYIQ